MNFIINHRSGGLGVAGAGGGVSAGGGGVGIAGGGGGRSTGGGGGGAEGGSGWLFYSVAICAGLAYAGK